MCQSRKKQKKKKEKTHFVVCGLQISTFLEEELAYLHATMDCCPVQWRPSLQTECVNLEKSKKKRKKTHFVVCVLQISTPLEEELAHLQVTRQYCIVQWRERESRVFIRSGCLHACDDAFLNHNLDGHRFHFLRGALF